MQEINPPPIDFIPKADDALSEAKTKHFLKALYLSLLWLALPIQALTRHSFGARYLSTLIITFSGASYFLTLILMVLLTLTGYPILVFLAPILAILCLRKIWYFLIIFAVLLATVFLVHLENFSQNWTNLLGLFFGSIGNIFDYIGQQAILYIALIFVLFLLYAIIIIHKMLAHAKEIEGNAIHSYYYGRSYTWYICGKDWIANIIIEPLCIIFLFGMLAESNNPLLEAFSWIVLFSGTASFILSLMQQHATRRYYQNLGDSKRPTDKIMQEHQEALTTKKEVFKASGIRRQRAT